MNLNCKDKLLVLLWVLIVPLSKSWYSYGYLLFPSCCRFVLFMLGGRLMLSLSDKNQASVIEAFNFTSRYLDDLLNIDHPYFQQMVSQIYPAELQLNKANSSDTGAPFLDLDLNFTITNDIVSLKFYRTQDCFILK